MLIHLLLVYIVYIATTSDLRRIGEKQPLSTRKDYHMIRLNTASFLVDLGVWVYSQSNSICSFVESFLNL